MKKAIIFDTNAYRTLAGDKILLLREHEQKAGHFVLASPVVIWELLTHLATESDPDYHRCMSALVALGKHAETRPPSNGGISIFADHESTVCRELFGGCPPNHEEGFRNLGSLVTYVVNNAPSIIDSRARLNIEAIAKTVAAKEREWLAQMTVVLNSCHPRAACVFLGEGSDADILAKMRSFFSSEVFMDAWAMFIVASHARLLGVDIPNDEFHEKCRIVREVFPVPFFLMSALLQKIALPEPLDLANPKRKRWNFIWDSMLAFSIGSNHEVDGRPIYLVTGDREIRAAAEAAQCGARILSLDDYLTDVGFPSLTDTGDCRPGPSEGSPQ